MKYARIVIKQAGTRWELRAGYKGKGQLLAACTHVIPNQQVSRDSASLHLEGCAERQGYKIWSEWDLV